MNRRSFLQWMAAWGSFLGGGLAFPNRPRGEVQNGFLSRQSPAGSIRPAVMGRTSRVVTVCNQTVFLEGNEVNSLIADQMVAGGMSRLTGETSADAAWKKLFKPDDVV